MKARTRAVVYPINPPMVPRSPASVRKRRVICLGVAPSDFMMPMSLVLSATLVRKVLAIMRPQMVRIIRLMTSKARLTMIKKLSRFFNSSALEVVSRLSSLRFFLTCSKWLVESILTIRSEIFFSEVLRYC